MNMASGIWHTIRRCKDAGVSQMLQFQYEEDEFPMVTNLSFSVNDGEFVSVIGASGCGKSTLFRLINGLEKPQSGEILVN